MHINQIDGNNLNPEWKGKVYTSAVEAFNGAQNGCKKRQKKLVMEPSTLEESKQL